MQPTENKSQLRGSLMSKDLKPTLKINVEKTFKFDSELSVHGFPERGERVPEIDINYKFDKTTTLAKLRLVIG